MQVVETDPSVVPRYRTYIPTMCKLLRQLLQTGMSPEHDIGGITNPFLQVGGSPAFVGFCLASIAHQPGASCIV